MVAYHTPIDWESIIMRPRALFVMCVYVCVCHSVCLDRHIGNRDAQQRMAGSVETIKYSGKTIVGDKMLFCVHLVCHRGVICIWFVSKMF